MSKTSLPLVRGMVAVAIRRMTKASRMSTQENQTRKYGACGLPVKR